MNYIIENKPIHIGQFLWKKDSGYNLNGTKYLSYYLSTGHSLVYFLLKEGIDIQGEYFFFQYAKEEETENVRFVGTAEDFEAVEVEYMDMDEMTRFGYYYPIKAIVIPNFGIQNFYYYIPNNHVKSNSELFGYFNSEEEKFLYRLYNRNPSFF